MKVWIYKGDAVAGQTAPEQAQGRPRRDARGGGADRPDRPRRLRSGASGTPAGGTEAGRAGAAGAAAPVAAPVAEAEPLTESVAAQTAPAESQEG